MPAGRVWSQRWRETPGRYLSGRIPAIVLELEKATVWRSHGSSKRESARRRLHVGAERLNTERWRREGEVRRAMKDRREALLEIVDVWAAAKRLEECCADVERRAQDLPDEQRERTIERSRRARGLLDRTNALERFDAWRAPESDFLGKYSLDQRRTSGLA